MYYFEKKNSKIFSAEGPREKVWGPRKNVSPSPAVALGGPEYDSTNSDGLDTFCDTMLRDTIEGRMMSKATRGQEHLQMLSDITNKYNITLKRDAEDRSSWQRSSS